RDGPSSLNTSPSVSASGDVASPALREVVSGIGEGLKRSGKNLRRVEWDMEASRAIELLLPQAAQTAADSQAPLAARMVAIRLLALDTFDRVNATLAGLLETKQPQEVQLAAVAAI